MRDISEPGIPEDSSYHKVSRNVEGMSANIVENPAVIERCIDAINELGDERYDRALFAVITVLSDEFDDFEEQVTEGFEVEQNWDLANAISKKFGAFRGMLESDLRQAREQMVDDVSDQDLIEDKILEEMVLAFEEADDALQERDAGRYEHAASIFYVLLFKILESGIREMDRDSLYAEAISASEELARIGVERDYSQRILRPLYGEALPSDHTLLHLERAFAIHNSVDMSAKRAAELAGVSFQTFLEKAKEFDAPLHMG